MVLRELSGRCLGRAWVVVSMVGNVGELGSENSECAERYGRVCSSESSCLWCMAKSVGGCFGDTGPGEQGCSLECAGVTGGEGGCCYWGSVSVVDDALESLASKTVAVRGGKVRSSVLRAKRRRRRMLLLRVSASEYCLVVVEIAGAAAAKADTRLARVPGAGLSSAGTQRDRRVENVDLEGKIRKPSFGSIYRSKDDC